MKRVMHMNTTWDIVRSADERKPIAALCGYTRIISERRRARAVAEGWPVCRDCERIADAMVATGQFNAAVHPRESIADMRERIANSERAKWWTVTAVSCWSFDPNN